MPDPRVAFCLFCDDIRAEVGNKYSVMGIYGRDIIFPNPPPGLLQKFGFILWLHCDIGDEPERVVITMLANKEEVLRIESSLIRESFPEEDNDATKRHLRMTVPMPPFEFQGSGVVEVFIDTGREQLRAGRLYMRFPQTPPAISDSESQGEQKSEG
jgi:hypothetical protein